MPEISIADGFYVDGSLPIASQECVNWIPQVPQANALSQAQLVGTPGIKEFTDTLGGASRGFHVMGGIVYSINGNQLYRVNSNLTADMLGTIDGAGRVSIDNNGQQMCIVVPNSISYIYSVAGGLQVITDVDFTSTLGPSEQVTAVDGYFIHFNNNSLASSSPIFFSSALKDGLSYDSLDFSTAEANPDAITGVHTSRSQLYVCGDTTVEPFANVGGADFPFQRISGGVVPRGIAAKFSLIDFNESFVFVGGGENEQPAIWQFTGTSALKISTQAIDNLIQELSDTEQKEIFATTYSENGGQFVNFHMKTRVMTFDASASQLSGTPKWHERQSKTASGLPAPWRVNGIINAYGKTLVSDNQDGRIGELDRGTYTEYGVDINRPFSIMPLQNQGKRVTVTRMEITTESGVGLPRTTVLNPTTEAFTYTFPFTLAGPNEVSGVTPQLVRSFSDNGGKEFSNETARSIGEQGQYNKRQIWRMDGQFDRFRVYRFSMNDPVKPVIIKMDITLRVMVNDLRL